MSVEQLHARSLHFVCLMAAGLAVVIDPRCSCIRKLPPLPNIQRECDVLHPRIALEHWSECWNRQGLAAIERTRRVQPLHRNHIAKIASIFWKQIQSWPDAPAGVTWFAATMECPQQQASGGSRALILLIDDRCVHAPKVRSRFERLPHSR